MSAKPRIHWTGYILHKVNALTSDNISEVNCKKCLDHFKRKENKKNRITKYGLSRNTLANKISDYLCHKEVNTKDKYVAFLNHRLSTWDKNIAAHIDAVNVAKFDNLTLANRFFEDDKDVFFVLMSDVKKNGLKHYQIKTESF